MYLITKSSRYGKQRYKKQKNIYFICDTYLKHNLRRDNFYLIK